MTEIFVPHGAPIELLQTLTKQGFIPLLTVQSDSKNESNSQTKYKPGELCLKLHREPRTWYNEDCDGICIYRVFGFDDDEVRLQLVAYHKIEKSYWYRWKCSVPPSYDFDFKHLLNEHFSVKDAVVFQDDMTK
jgi:hypothetical protein